ncbi:MAG: acyl-CoA thioesterase [Planctomycetaceae bacterium]
MLREHEIAIRVRYSETDAQGALHHSQYANYFEMGRTELFRAGGGDYRAMERAGLFFVVSQLSCKYHRPARYDDLLTLRTRILRISQAKLEHEYLLFRGEDHLTTGRTVLACVDAAGKIQRIPEVLERVMNNDRAQ